MTGREDAEAPERKYKAPFSGHNPIPTVQNYRKEKQAREAADGGSEDLSRTERAKDAYDRYKHGPQHGESPSEDDLYPAHNMNVGDRAALEQAHRQEPGAEQTWRRSPDDNGDVQDTSEATVGNRDPKTQRKEMKKRKGGAEREVTDPVTHLPVKIHDFTNKDLDRAPENDDDPNPGINRVTSDGLKDESDFEKDGDEQQAVHEALQSLFPPPNFDSLKDDLAAVYRKAIIVAVTVVSMSLVFVTLTVNLIGFVGISATIYSAIFLVLGLSASGAAVWGTQGWAQKKAIAVWENETWEAERQSGKKAAKSQIPESTQWLNSLLGSVWPLINPDLFTSLADTLEDVMQASLPSMIRMVSVDDIGQGSESIRILGIKWLPTGAAGKSVDKDGNIKSAEEERNSDRKVPGEGEVQQGSENTSQGTQGGGDEDGKQENEDEQNIAEGMEAEEGDFINMEIAFSYRTRGKARNLKHRAKNAHLYLAFYLPAGIKIPIWVELHGVVGTMRVRLQLTPDPPFFSLCTLTFLGQPKIDVSCIPLSKRAVNVMDVPLISNFVQSSIDAGLSTMVAPHNLTLDLKDMITGSDFKKDTAARGVLMVTIKRGYDFKEGDSGIGPFKKGSSDPYVSVGWAKFGKPVWSTRVLLSEMEPWWEETVFVLVTPEELNVDERLRVQLWDSDRTSADDDLGRIEVDLKEIMRDARSNGKVWNRNDGFRSLDKDKSMPGHLEWSIGYFSKTRVLDSQLATQTSDTDIKTVDDLKKKVAAESERKLREAKKDETAELEQQKAQDFKERQDDLISASPPSVEFPSGILSVQIHQISGLELETLSKRDAQKHENDSDEEEEGDDLPSSYCTIILNHQKVYKTRTKPKNAKPFFNAGTERFIRDWRSAEIHIAVRDSRVHEEDPLLGMVYLPLAKIFARRSQISDVFPLSGGVGFGKARISLMFRSVQLNAPRELLGWDFGTLEIEPTIKALDSLPRDLQEARLKVRTALGKGKFTSKSDESGTWQSKSGKSVKLAVRKRYSSSLVIEFRQNSALRDSTIAFAILWLKDIPDDESKTLKLPVWKGDLKRAEANTLPESGQQHGTLEISLKFWAGLSGYHGKLASKDHNLANVMEVLDVAHDNDEADMHFSEQEGRHGESSSEDDSTEDDDSDTPTTTASEDSGDDGKRGMVDAVRDFKSNKKDLHRRNRGLMQWKAPRTANWAKNKVKHAGDSVTSLFKHHDRDPGIETEA